MNTLFLIGASAAALIAGPALAVQQNASRPAAQPLTLASFQSRVEAKFVRTDANKDGFISQSEATAAASSQPSREQRLAARQQRQAKRAERLARLDTNKDGAISAAERQERAAARRGGQAQSQEVRAERRAERRSERQAMRGLATLRLNDKRFARLDVNKDNRLSLQEVTTRSALRFSRLDQNKDGSLTREERRDARARRHSRQNG
jgi:Ca2+-binding EF-hand superfamily protein